MTKQATLDQAQDGKNEPAVADDALAMVNLSRIRKAQEIFASENGSLRNVYAQAERQGLHLAAAKKAIKVAKSGKRDELIEEISKTLYYLKLMRCGVQESQISLFEYEPSLAPIDEKAAADGRFAGFDGQDESSNPHAINTVAGQAWLNAFRQGAAERELILSMPDPVSANDDDGEGDELSNRAED